MNKPNQTPGKTSKQALAPFSLLIGLQLILFLPAARGQRPLGTDVSGYQPSVNWTTVKNAGVKFAWTKATEGTYYVNPYFTSQEAGAKSVGIYIGAYHYARPYYDPNITGANSADTEAAYFWNTASAYVKNGGAYLVPMLDWEDVAATNFTAATLSAWVNEWCTAVSNYARASGVTLKPVVYTGTWYSNPANGYPGLNTSVTNWPDWISAYPSNPNPQTGGPSSSYPWTSWNIWQYADTNWSGGDSDVYNGSLSGFVQTFVIGGTNAPVITVNPTNVTVAPGASAAFFATATGQTPLNYYWLFNGANIPGATSTNFTISNVQLTNAGNYSVLVSNSYAAVPSVTAFLSVTAPLTNPVGSILGPANMVDWWPGEGNTKDIYGAYNASPKNNFYYVTGKEGLGFHFDGASSYLTTGAPSLAAPWTLCLWVNRQNAPGVSAALMSDGTYALKLEQYNLSRKVGITQAGVGDYAYNYTAPLGTWVHLAFVNNGSQTLLYANGVLQGGTNSIPLPRAYIGVTYFTSGSVITDYLLGGIDEIMCFSRALSASEIGSIYSAGSSGLVRVPQFTSAGPWLTGAFPLGLRGLTGKTFTLYSSTDFVHWTSLGAIANPTGSVQYTNSSATNDYNFYRASQP